MYYDDFTLNRGQIPGAQRANEHGRIQRHDK